MKATLTVTLLMAVATTAGAQSVVVRDQDAKAAAEHQLQVMLEKAPASGIHLSFEVKPVTGAPYTAEAVTEFLQVLADGNRIVRRTVTRVYRDSAGRTRRETVEADGRVTSIVISDPTTGTSYVLDPVANTAHGAKLVTAFVPKAAAGVDHAQGPGVVTTYVSTSAQQRTEAKALKELQLQAHLTAGQSGVTVVGPPKEALDTAGSAPVPSKEDLGQQTIEGVLARGTRTTTVIPAGAIGNEQPIKDVLEEWHSEDLKVLVLTKHVDPRAGETTYRLTNITRGDPNPSLFAVPAGYLVK